MIGFQTFLQSFRVVVSPSYQRFTRYLKSTNRTAKFAMKQFLVAVSFGLHEIRNDQTYFLAGASLSVRGAFSSSSTPLLYVAEFTFHSQPSVGASCHSYSVVTLDGINAINQ